MSYSFFSNLVYDYIVEQVLNNNLSVYHGLRPDHQVKVLQAMGKPYRLLSFFMGEQREGYGVDNYNLRVMQETVNQQVLSRATEAISELTRKIENIESELQIKGLSGKLDQSDIVRLNNIFSNFSTRAGFNDFKSQHIYVKKNVDDFRDKVKELARVQSDIIAEATTVRGTVESLKTDTDIQSIMSQVEDLQSTIANHVEFLNMFQVKGLRLFMSASELDTNIVKKNIADFKRKLLSLHIYGGKENSFDSEISRISNFLMKYLPVLGKQVTHTHEDGGKVQDKVILNVLNDICLTESGAASTRNRMTKLKENLDALNKKMRTLNASSTEYAAAMVQLKSLMGEIARLKDNTSFNEQKKLDMEDNFLSRVETGEYFSQEDFWEGSAQLSSAVSGIISKVTASKDLFSESLSKYEESLRKVNPLYKSSESISIKKKKMQSLFTEVNNIVQRLSDVSTLTFSYSSVSNDLGGYSYKFMWNDVEKTADEVIYEFQQTPWYSGNSDRLVSDRVAVVDDFRNSLGNVTGVSPAAKSFAQTVVEDYGNDKILRLVDYFNYLYKRGYLLDQRRMARKGDSSGLSLNFNRIYKTLLSKGDKGHVRNNLENDVYLNAFYDVVLGLKDGESEDRFSESMSGSINTSSSILNFFGGLNSKIGSISSYFAAKKKLGEISEYRLTVEEFLSAVKDFSKNVNKSTSPQEVQHMVAELYQMAYGLPDVVFSLSDSENPIQKGSNFDSIQGVFRSTLIELAARDKYADMFESSNSESLKKFRTLSESIRLIERKLSEKKKTLLRFERSLESLRKEEELPDGEMSEDGETEVKASLTVVAAEIDLDSVAEGTAGNIENTEASIKKLKAVIKGLEKELDTLREERMGVESGLQDLKLRSVSDTSSKAGVSVFSDLFGDIYVELTNSSQYHNLQVLATVDPAKADEFVGLVRELGSVTSMLKKDPARVSYFTRILMSDKSFRNAFSKFKSILPIFGVNASGRDEDLLVSNAIFKILGEENLSQHANLRWLLGDRLKTIDTATGTQEITDRFKAFAGGYYELVSLASADAVADAVLTDSSALGDVASIYTLTRDKVDFLRAREKFLGSEAYAKKIAGIESEAASKISALDNGGAKEELEGQDGDIVSLIDSKGLTKIGAHLDKLKSDKALLSELVADILRKLSENGDFKPSFDNVFFNRESLLLSKLSMLENQSLEDVIASFRKSLAELQGQMDQVSGESVDLRKQFYLDYEARMAELLDQKEKVSKSDRPEFNRKINALKSELADFNKVNGESYRRQREEITNKITALRASHADNVAMFSDPDRAASQIKSELKSFKKAKSSLFNKYLVNVSDYSSLLSGRDEEIDLYTRALEVGNKLKSKVRESAGQSKAAALMSEKLAFMDMSGNDKLKNFESTLSNRVSRLADLTGKEYNFEDLETLTGLDIASLLKQGLSGNSTTLDYYLGGKFSDKVMQSLNNVVFNKMFSNYPQDTAISSFFDSLTSNKDIRAINLQGYIVNSLANAVVEYSNSERLASNPYGTRGAGEGLRKVSLDALLGNNYSEDDMASQFTNVENLDYTDFVDLESPVTTEIGSYTDNEKIYEEERVRSNITVAIDKMVNHLSRTISLLSDESKLIGSDSEESLFESLSKEDVKNMFGVKRPLSEVREIRQILYKSLGRTGLRNLFLSVAKLDRIIGRKNFQDFDKEVLSSESKFVKTAPSYVILRFFVLPFIKYWAEGKLSPVDFVKKELTEDLLSGARMRDLARLSGGTMNLKEASSLSESVLNNISNMLQSAIDEASDEIVNFDAFSKYLEKSVFNRANFLRAISVLAIPFTYQVVPRFDKLYYVGNAQSAALVKNAPNEAALLMELTQQGNNPSQELQENIYGEGLSVKSNSNLEVFVLDFSKGFKFDQSNPVFASAYKMLKSPQRLAAVTNIIRPIFKNYMSGFIKGVSNYVDKDMSGKFLLDTFLQLNQNSVDMSEGMAETSGRNRRSNLTEAEMHNVLVELYTVTRISNPKKYNSKSTQGTIDSYLTTLKSYLSRVMPQEIFSTIDFSDIGNYIKSRDFSNVYSFLVKKNDEFSQFMNRFAELETAVMSNPGELVERKGAVDKMYSEFVASFKKPVAKAIGYKKISHPLIQDLANFEPRFNKLKASLDHSALSAIELNSRKYLELNKSVVETTKSLKESAPGTSEYAKNAEARAVAVQRMLDLLSNFSEGIEGGLFSDPNNLANISNYLGDEALKSTLAKSYDFFSTIKGLEGSKSFAANAAICRDHAEKTLQYLSGAKTKFLAENKQQYDSGFDIESMLAEAETLASSATIYDGVATDLESLVSESGLDVSKDMLGVPLLPDYIINGKKRGTEDYVMSFKKVLNSLVSGIKRYQSNLTDIKALRAENDQEQLAYVMKLNSETNEEIRSYWSVLMKMVGAVESENLRGYLLSLIGSMVAQSKASAARFTTEATSMKAGVSRLKSTMQGRLASDFAGKSLADIRGILKSEYESKLHSLESSASKYQRALSNCEKLNGLVEGINIENQKTDDGRLNKRSLLTSFDFYASFLDKFSNILTNPVYNKSFPVEVRVKGADGAVQLKTKNANLRETFEDSYLSGAVHTLYRVLATGILDTLMQAFESACDKYVASDFKNFKEIVTTSEQLVEKLSTLKSLFGNTYNHIVQRLNDPTFETKSPKDFTVYKKVMTLVLGSAANQMSSSVSNPEFMVEQKYKGVVLNRLLDLFDRANVETELVSQMEQGLSSSEFGVYDYYDKVNQAVNNKFGPVTKSFGDLSNVVGLTRKSNPYGIVMGLPAVQKVNSLFSSGEYMRAYSVYNASRKLMTGLREKMEIENMFRSFVESTLRKYGFTKEGLVSNKFELIMNKKSVNDGLRLKLSKSSERLKTLRAFLSYSVADENGNIPKEFLKDAGFPSSVIRSQKGDVVPMGILVSYVDAYAGSLGNLEDEIHQNDIEISKLSDEYAGNIKGVSVDKVEEFSNLYSQYGDMLREFAPDYILNFFGLNKGKRSGSSRDLEKSLSVLKETLDGKLPVKSSRFFAKLFV